MQGWSDLEKSLIRDIAKLTAVLELGLKSRTKPWLCLVCILWVSYQSDFALLFIQYLPSCQ